MARLANCPDCGAAVSRGRLAQHREKVHGMPPALPTDSATASKKRRSILLGPVRIVILAFIIIIGAFIAYSYLATKQYGPHGPVNDECVAHGAGASYHIHVDLRITVNGSPIQIPDGIGLAPCMRPIHTHDDSGKIHVEYQIPSHFRLGEFFDVWGQPFSPTQVLDHHVVAGTSLKMSVGGRPSTSFGDLQLEDGQLIEIVYA